MDLLSIPIVIAFVEMLKRTGLHDRYAPLASLATGLVIALVFSPEPLVTRIGMGIILGLSASGLYSGSRALLKE